MNIYLSTENDFIHNGLGFLTDFQEAMVTDNLNGDYYLIFKYKVNGHLSEYLQNENIVKCQVADGTKQLFIIKSVNKDFDMIEVTCKHIFYLLLDNFVENAAPTILSCQPYLTWVLNRTNYPCEFTIFSDITVPRSGRYVRKNPVEIILGDADNSIVNLFNCELRRDNFNIYLNNTIGNDNGVKLIVGKNITGIKITTDTSSVYTRIMPQGFDGLLLPEKYVDSLLINSYPNPKIYKVDFSDIKYDPEDENAYHNIDDAYVALRNATRELYQNGIDKPVINVKVDWIELSKTNEYKNYSNLEKVGIGDTVTIDLLGVSYKTKVIKTVYNVMTGRIDSFELGTPKANIGTSTSIIKKQLEEVNPTSFLESARAIATQLLTKAMGGYVYKTQNELFIMDTNNPDTAVKIWRWNMNGLGYSKSGIDGPYETAITADGKIVADFITAGKIDTSVIEGYDSITATVKDAKAMVDGQNKKISQVIQTVADLTSKISNIADITTSGESNFGFVSLENINQSEPIQIKIHPVGEDISYLYPSDDLYPSDTLFSKNRVLRFTNTVTEEFYDYELPEDLLYYDENTYDEFLLNYDSQTCYINKKLRHTSVNGINELLEQSQIIELEYPKISLSDGNYKIELLGYQNGYIYCQLMAANIYTTQFATRVEMNSKISQTAEEINNTVSKKVGDDEIISKINQTAEGIKILANKLGLTANDVLNIIAGNEINLTSQNISINSTNFKVDKDGNVVANNGTFNGKINSKSGEIAGWSVTENGLTNGTVFLNKDGSSTIYTVADLIIMRGYIMDIPGFSFSKAMIEHYDLNGDGVVNAQDYAMLQKLIGISMG